MPSVRFRDRILLLHAKGSSAEILFYGATIISWKSGNTQNQEPVERLFVSSKAALDGTKPVRGGIPIVFPCFGAPSHPDHAKLGQHGFARNEIWQWDGLVVDDDAGVSVRLTLDPTERIRHVYDQAFHLEYVITLAEHQLSADLHIENTAISPPEALEFQALLHNYIHAPADDVIVTPLQHLTYYDKTASTEQERSTAKVELRTAVDVKSVTDFVYEDAPQNYQVRWPGGGITIKSKNFKDVVVWNPGEGGNKIADMEEGGWERYICVEPGYVRGFVKIDVGKRWTGQQVLTVMAE